MSPEDAVGAAAPEMAKTAVTKWLTENHATGAVVERFYSEGYYELSEVDEAAIDDIVPEKGTLKRLKLSLEKLHPKPAEVQEPLEAPELPAGTTLDLTEAAVRPTATYSNRQSSSPSRRPR